MSKIYRFVFNEIQDNPNTFTVLASLGSVKSSVKNSDGLSSIYKFAEFLEERGYQQFSEIEDNIFKEVTTFKDT
jgi:hypothetical protein